MNSCSGELAAEGFAAVDSMVEVQSLLELCFEFTLAQFLYLASVHVIRIKVHGPGHCCSKIVSQLSPNKETANARESDSLTNFTFYGNLFVNVTNYSLLNY